MPLAGKVHRHLFCCRNPTSAHGYHLSCTGHLCNLPTSSSKPSAEMQHLSLRHMKAKAKGKLKKPEPSKTPSSVVSSSSNLLNVPGNDPSSPPNVCNSLIQFSHFLIFQNPSRNVLVCYFPNRTFWKVKWTLTAAWTREKTIISNLVQASGTRPTTFYESPGQWRTCRRFWKNPVIRYRHGIVNSRMRRQYR